MKINKFTFNRSIRQLPFVWQMCQIAHLFYCLWWSLWLYYRAQFWCWIAFLCRTRTIFTEHWQIIKIPRALLFLLHNSSSQLSHKSSGAVEYIFETIRINVFFISFDIDSVRLFSLELHRSKHRLLCAKHFARKDESLFVTHSMERKRSRTIKCAYLKLIHQNRMINSFTGNEMQQRNWLHSNWTDIDAHNVNSSGNSLFRNIPRCFVFS